MMQRLDGHPPELVVALLPGLVRTMLETFLDELAGHRPRS
jgi:hypothetical protein